VFETLSDRLTQVFAGLRSRGRLSPADIDATCREIRIALLEADVALPVVREFIAQVRERALGADVVRALNPAQQVIKIVNEELVEILGGEARRLQFAKVAPTVIMLAGLQGSGKTTLAAKLALWLRGQGNTPLLVAADLQRPNAVQQLQVLGERAGVPVYAPEPGNGVGDPVKVSRDSLAEARHRLNNIVIIDTAGRLGVDEEMMRQAAAIRDATDPDEILYVVDAMIGQDAVRTAQAFLDGVGFDAVVLTKLDGDARGGAALSIAKVTGRPVMFASAGEKLEDFDLFHPDRMASRILDLGDVLTLIEQAERTFDADQAAAMAGKMVSAEGFTLEDFVEQLAMVRKLGPIGNLLGMLPGAAQNRDLLSQITDKDLDRAAAIVNSMTPEERRNPKVLNGSRRLRIANGAGVTVTEVNSLVTRFMQGQKMMRQMMGGMPGMPGLPGMPGTRRAKTAKGKKKGRSGGSQPARGGELAGGRPAGGQTLPAGGRPAGGETLPAGFGPGGPDGGLGGGLGGGQTLPAGFGRGGGQALPAGFGPVGSGSDDGNEDEVLWGNASADGGLGAGSAASQLPPGLRGSGTSKGRFGKKGR
jgi:signal recognition particle subunit SRP54